MSDVVSALVGPRRFGACQYEVLPTGHESGMRRLVLSISALCTLVAAPSVAEIIEEYPDVMVCRVGEHRVVAYLHLVHDDGSAVYMTVGRASATVTPDGVFQREGAADCDGKTLDQMEQDGQANRLD